jgi:hypothetical protein
MPDARRREILRNLESTITFRIQATPDFDRTSAAVVVELRGLGHDLFLFDTDGEWQVWLGDWTREASTRLVLRLSPKERAEVAWSDPDVPPEK